MASKRIKGITIEINGDTSDLAKALSGVDKQLSATQTALRDIDKLLKIDPGNVELLEQQQRELADAIDGTKDRLKALRDQQEAMEDSLRAGDISQQQYDAYRREIIETENKLKDLEDRQKSLADTVGNRMQAAGKHMEEFGAKVSNIGDKMSTLGTTMSKYVTGPIVAAAGLAAAAWKEVDDAQDAVVKATGATGEEAERLNEIMTNVATSIPESYADIGSALGTVATRFSDAGDDVEGLTTDFLKFAKVNNTDVKNAITGTDKLMERFGVESKDTGAVLGILTRSAQTSGKSIDALMQQVSGSSEQLQDMGLNLAESVDLMTRLDVAGLDTAVMLKGLKTAQQNAAKEGKTLDDALKDISERIQNAGTETEKLNIASETFGSKGAAEFVKALEDGALSLENLNDDMSQYTTLVGDTYEATLDPIDEVTIAVNNLKAVGKDVFDELMKSAAPVIEEVTDWIRGVRDSWNGLDEETQQHIIKIGLVVAAIGPVLTIVGKVVSGIGGVVSAVGKATGAIGGLITKLSGITVSGGAVGLAIAGVAALAGGVIALVNAINNAPSALDTLITESEAFAKASETYAQNMQDTATQYETTAGTVDIYIGRLEELEREMEIAQQAGDDTSEAMGEYRTIINLLNDEIPGLNAVIDEQTGYIEGGTQALKDKTQAWLDEQKAAAYIETYGDYIKAAAKAEAEHEINVRKLAAAEQKVADVKQRQADIEAKQTEINRKRDQYWNNSDVIKELNREEEELLKTRSALGEELAKAEDEQRNYKDAVLITGAALEEHADNVDAAREGYAELIAEQEKAEEAAEDVGDAVEETGGKFIQSARDTDEYLKTLEQTREDIGKTIGAFQNMSYEVDITGQDLLDALTSQIQYMDHYADNLKKAAERGVNEGLLATLSDGSIESAKYLDAINSMTDEELQKLNDLWIQSAEKQSTDYAQALTDGKMGITGAVDVIIADMIAAFDAKSECARKQLQEIGTYITSGLSVGIDNPIARRYLTSTVQRVVDVVTGTTTSGLEISSPSKVMERLGRYVSEGFADGITDEIGTIEKAATKAADAGMIAGAQAEYTSYETWNTRRVPTTTNNTTNNTTATVSPTINIYAQPGQSAEDIADAVSEALAQQYADAQAAWG